MECVQWNRVRLHLDQGHRQVDEVFVLFSHSDDPTRADFQSCRSGVPDGAEPILKGVRGADRGVKGFARIQVVVDTIDSCRFQTLGLLFTHEAQRTANLNRNFLLDRTDGSCDFVDFTIQGTPTADDDAIALGLRGRRLSGAVNHLLLGHEVIALDGGGGDRRLGTVVTVFLASPAFGVLQHLEPNGLAEITGSDGKGGLEESQQLLIWSVEHGLAFASESASRHARLCQRIPDSRPWDTPSSVEVELTAMRMAVRVCQAEPGWPKTYTVSKGEAMPW